MITTSNDTLASSPEAASDNVRSVTEQEINRQIDAKIEESIRHYATQSPEAISNRIQELDQEWDIERHLAMTASSVGLGTVLLSFLGGGKKWLLLTGTAMGFLMNHALRGWCPPVPLFRKLGVRTRAEIDREKYALKILRGDFQLPPNKLEQLKTNPAQDVLRSVT